MSNVKRQQKQKGDSSEPKKRRSCSGIRKLSKKMKGRQAQGRKKARAAGKEFVSYRARNKNSEIDRMADEKGTSRAQLVYQMSLSQRPSKPSKIVQPQMVFTGLDRLGHLAKPIFEQRAHEQKIRRRREDRAHSLLTYSATCM